MYSLENQTQPLDLSVAQIKQTNIFCEINGNVKLYKRS